MRVCGVILSGGKSSRMGENKALLPVQNTPVIKRIADELAIVADPVVVIANDTDAYRFLDLDIYPDTYIDKGPLAGIESALDNVDADVFVIAACDMPFVNSTVYGYLLEQLEDYQAVVPIYNDRAHPMSAIYTKAILPEVQKQLEQNCLRMNSFFPNIKVKYVEIFASLDEKIVDRHFFNMNDRVQYEQAKNF